MNQEYYDTKNHIKTEKALDDDCCWLKKLKNHATPTSYPNL